MTAIDWLSMLVKPRTEPPAVDLQPPNLSHPHWVNWPNPQAHRYQGGGCSACLIPVPGHGGGLMSTDELRRLRLPWCRVCFPGRRCRVCGVPSGAHDECGEHLAESIATDKAIERAI